MASDEAILDDGLAQGLREHPAKNGMRFNVLVTLVEVGGAIALFHLARWMGASDVASYLVGSIGPVVGGILVWARARKFSGASAAIFAFTALSAIIALSGSATARVLLYKDCATMALVGLIFLASRVLARKPLIFYMAQRFGTDGTHEGMANFDTLWGLSRDFRTGVYVINYLWSALFLVEAGVIALIIRDTTYSTAYNFDQILPLVASAAGIVGSIAIGRTFTKRGWAHAAAASANHQPPRGSMGEAEDRAPTAQG